MSDRRISDRRGGDKELDDRVEQLEQTVAQIAPVAVHLAEMNIRSAEIARQQADLRGDMKEGQAQLHAELNAWVDRLDRRLDPLHTRLRRAEYALVAVVLAIGSPKVGGPDVVHTTSTLIRTWLG